LIDSTMADHNQPPEIAKRAHPTAKAFFDALDTQSSSSKQSETLKRRSQSLGWRNRYSQATYYPVSVQGTQFSVHQVQRGEVEGTYGTGATVWPAALVLIKYLEHNPALVKEKKVVDLGSGTGLTSVASALLGATTVICTDGEDNVVRLANDNIQHALLEVSKVRPEISLSKDIIQVQTYCWGDGSMKDQDCDVVLVADCVLPKLYPIAPLVQAIDELLVLPSSVAILSYEHRYFPEYDPRDKFGELAAARGLQMDVISPEKMDPIYCVDDIEIWHVTRKLSS
jgi:predicted nicotinamide N-methyase